MNFNPHLLTLACTCFIFLLMFMVFWFNPPIEIDSKLKKSISTSLVVSLIVAIVISIFVNLFSINMVIEKTEEKTRTETIEKYRGFPIFKLKHGEIYEFDYGSNNKEEVILLLKPNSSPLKLKNLYFFILGKEQIRDSNNKVFEDINDIPKRFRVQWTKFQVPAGDDRYTEIGGWILHPLKILPEKS